MSLRFPNHDMIDGLVVIQRNTLLDLASHATTKEFVEQISVVPFLLL